MEIPVIFEIPILLGIVDRTLVSNETIPGIKSDQNHIITPHTLAYVKCVLGIELFMRAIFPEEIAMIIAEDGPAAKNFINLVHSYMKDDRAVRDIGKYDDGLLKILLPLERVREAPNFVGKRNSKCLQLADIVAFAAKKHIANATDASRFFDPLRPSIRWPVDLAYGGDI